MYKKSLFALLLVLMFNVAGIAQNISQEPIRPELPQQMDSRQTLEWVVQRCLRIEKVINSAMLTHDHANLMMRLLDAYVEFDAISLVGLYCKEAQASAEKGRESSDLLTYRKENDLNSIMLRALDAKEQAIKVRHAATNCLKTPNAEEETTSFAPQTTLIDEANWAILDLEDGLASQDFHIFSQKTEHAIRLIEEIEHIASTLDNCAFVEAKAKEAKAACLNAMGAPNWLGINRAVKQAKTALSEIQSASCTLAKE